jgi:hypothetical protein
LEGGTPPAVVQGGRIMPPRVNIIPLKTAASPGMTRPDPERSTHGADEAQRRYLPTHRPFLDPETLGRLNGDDAAIAAIRERLNGPARHGSLRPSLYDRITNALGSKRMFDFYLGFYSGAMATVALAYLWSLA